MSDKEDFIERVMNLHCDMSQSKEEAFLKGYLTCAGNIKFLAEGFPMLDIIPEIDDLENWVENEKETRRRHFKIVEEMVQSAEKVLNNKRGKTARHNHLDTLFTIRK